MSIYSSFCTLKHRKSGSPRRSRAWSPRILNRRQHRDTVITFSHCCSDFERSCNICNKTIKSKSPSGLNNNFHNHLKTHGLNAKEYKAWQTKNQLGRAQPSSAAGFGGDFGGGDFGGGFDDQDDRGAQDERFKDVPDEARDNDKRASGIAAAPALMTLEDWLASTAVRQLLVQLEELWMAGAQRVRHKTSYETMITQLYAIKHAVRFIKSVEHLSKCMRVPTNLSELHEWAPSDLLEALGELLPPPQWLERISEEKALGSAIKSVNLLMRLMSWALPLVTSRLALQLRVGDRYPEHVLRAQGWLPLVQGVLTKARHLKLLHHRAGKQTVAAITDTWESLAREIEELALCKREALDAFGAVLDELADLNREELQSLSLLALIGYADLASLRHSVGHSLAQDLGELPAPAERMRKLTLYRNVGVLWLKVVGNQKDHLMMPYDLARAPLASAVLSALLSHEDFEQGGPIVNGSFVMSADGEVLVEHGTLHSEIVAGVQLLDLGTVPASLRNESQRGDGHHCNVMRRWHISMSFLATLWNIMLPAQFAALCYVQQHEPKTVFDKYFKLTGLDSSSPRWNSVALHATLWNERWRVQCTHRHRRAPKNSRAK
jgi:hypothetical protein